MDLADTVIERVWVERLDESVAGPFEPGVSRFAVVVEARGVTGVFAPVDELPAALVATRLGQSALQRPVTDHKGLLRRLLAELGPHSAGLGRWAVGALDCAVWDLHGRLADLPVAAQLSDRPARRVPGYASWLSLDLASPPAAESVRATAGEGFAFTKWALRDAEAGEVARLAEWAAAWAGQSVAVDALGTWGHRLATEVAPLLAPEVVRWVEDPLGRTDPAAYTQLRARAVGHGDRPARHRHHIRGVRADHPQPHPAAAQAPGRPSSRRARPAAQAHLRAAPASDSLARCAAPFCQPFFSRPKPAFAVSIPRTPPARPRDGSIPAAASAPSSQPPSRLRHAPHGSAAWTRPNGSFSRPLRTQLPDCNAA